MLPSTAIPSDAPSSRVASFMAEPAPARRGGTADMMAAVIGDDDSAMPDTSGTTQARMYQYDVDSVRARNMMSPMPTSVRPAATVRLAPKRSLSLGVSGETTIMIGAMGKNRSAESSGV